MAKKHVLLQLKRTNGGSREEQGANRQAPCAEAELGGGPGTCSAGGAGLWAGSRIAAAVGTCGVRVSGGDDAGAGGRRDWCICGRRRLRFVTKAEDLVVSSASSEEAVGEFLDSLVHGQAIDAAVVIVTDNIGTPAAPGHDVRVVAAERHRT
jgi:hypothetical protein